MTVTAKTVTYTYTDESGRMHRFKVPERRDPAGWKPSAKDLRGSRYQQDRAAAYGGNTCGDIGRAVPVASEALEQANVRAAARSARPDWFPEHRHVFINGVQVRLPDGTRDGDSMIYGKFEYTIALRSSRFGRYYEARCPVPAPNRRRRRL